MLVSRLAWNVSSISAKLRLFLEQSMQFGASLADQVCGKLASGPLTLCR